MRRGNYVRLPMPPKPAQSVSPEVKAIYDHVQLMTDLLNQNLQSVQNRLNTIQQTGAVPPPPVSSFVVTGKQGLFHLTWNKIDNVDGYIIMQATDNAMNQLTNRYNIPDGEQSSFDIPVGNFPVVSSFQVYGYQGNKVGLPSPIITSTSAVLSTATETAGPAAPPFRPQPPLLKMVRNGTTLA